VYVSVHASIWIYDEKEGKKAKLLAYICAFPLLRWKVRLGCAQCVSYSVRCEQLVQYLTTYFVPYTMFRFSTVKIGRKASLL
jgi:hypothetical protein